MAQGAQAETPRLVMEDNEDLELDIYNDSNMPRASAIEQAQAHNRSTQHNTGRLQHEQPRRQAEPELSSTHAGDILTDDWATASAAAIARAVARDSVMPPSAQLRTGVQARPAAAANPSIPLWSCGFGASGSAPTVTTDSVRDSSASVASPSPTRGLDFSSASRGDTSLPDARHALQPPQPPPEPNDPSHAAAEELAANPYVTVLRTQYCWCRCHASPLTSGLGPHH